jgi:hypothetical protein
MKDDRTSDAAGANGAAHKVLKFAAWALLAAVLLSAALLAAWVAWDEPMRHAVITLDDAPLELANLPGGQVLLAFVMAFVAVLVATIVVLVVVPLAVLLPLLVAGLVCTAVLLALACGLAVLLSPVLLLAWTVWRLSRPRRAVATIAP